MTGISDIIQECASDNSRLHKIAVLEKYKDDELLRRVLKAALDPYVQYYIRKIPPYEFKGGKSLPWALDELGKLSSRQLTGHAGIDHLKNILESLPKEDAELIERIISKDLKCGVAESTVNKVMKDLIPSYPVMLASSYNEKNLKRIVFPAFAQTKMDGMRANVIVHDGEVEVRSRNGKLIDLLGCFRHGFTSLSHGESVVYDGELLVVREIGTMDFLPRKIGNGIINKAVKGTITEKEAEKVRMIVWDRIPYEDFLKKKCTITYEERFEKLIIEVTDLQSALILPISSRIVNDMEEAGAFFDKMLFEGQEGIILKNKDSIWEDKRSRFHVKMKAEKEADLVVVDWIEGTGKYEGMLGAISCQTSDGGVQVNVGSGFTDEQRQNLKPTDLVGKVCAIKYNELIEKKGDNVKSLFLPIFIEVRTDKTEANKTSELK